MTHVAFAIYCIVLLGLLILIKVEHRPQGYAMPMVTTHGDEAEANRLYSPCPLSPKNIPPRRETDA